MDYDEYGRRTPRKAVSRGEPIRVDYTYADGSQESQAVTRKGPDPKPKYISGTQDGPVPEGVNITAKPRASGALRRTFTTHLNQMLAEERIDAEEHATREALALKAETDAELRVLIADLPGLPVEEKPEPKKTFADRRREFCKAVAKAWDSNLGSIVKYFLIGLSFASAVATAVIPTCVLLTNVHHPSGMAVGLSVTSIVAGIIWFVVSIVVLIEVVDG